MRRRREVRSEPWMANAACRGCSSVMLRAGSNARTDADSERRRILEGLALCGRCPVFSDCAQFVEANVRDVGSQIGDVIAGRLTDEWGRDHGVPAVAPGGRPYYLKLLNVPLT